jgi:RNA polymerase sigma-70 factor (ECF subfamily)
MVSSWPPPCLNVTVIEYIDTLYTYGMVLTDNCTETEDLVQETYVRAKRAVKKVKTGSNVKSWLLTIMRSIWLTQLRRPRITRKTVEIDLGERAITIRLNASTRTQTLFMNMLDCYQVREAIRRLPVDLREVIVFREYGELSYQEIASILDCPVDTVTSRLATGRSTLQTLLQLHSHPIP